MKPLEAASQYQGDEQQDGADQQGEPPVEIPEHAEGERAGQRATHELEDAGAEQVPHLLRVIDDAGDEGAGLGGIEVPGGQPQGVPLEPLPESGHHPLARQRARLGDAVRGERLDRNRESGGSRHRQQQLATAVADYIVDDHLRGEWERQRRNRAQDRADDGDQQHTPLGSDEGAQLACIARRRPRALVNCCLRHRSRSVRGCWFVRLRLATARELELGVQVRSARATSARARIESPLRKSRVRYANRKREQNLV